MDTEGDVAHFRELDGELLVVHGWQRLIPGKILHTFTHGALGAHGSAFGLPKGRGRSPMNWSLIEGLDRFLLSLITLDEGADSGNVVTTKKYDITDHDTISTLYYKLVVALEAMLVNSIPRIINGNIKFEDQSGEPTYYPKRAPEDGGIHWEDPTETIYNLIRAVTRPYPGAFTQCNGKRIFVWEAIPFSDDFVFEAEPGTIIQVFTTSGEFVVKTVDGTLLVRDWEADEWIPNEGMVLKSMSNESIGSPNRVDRKEHETALSSSE
jgi:UDP-4-amino-4-deoxy-L-arabinose formyltransferase/UDP-glucuronic acid dehydrogenase (UDP-4-keto-hexauronic acid decarboxylating)